MTTATATPEIHEVFTPDQLARAAALQVASEVTPKSGPFGGQSTDDLLDVAAYIIDALEGDEETLEAEVIDLAALRPRNVVNLTTYECDVACKFAPIPEEPIVYTEADAREQLGLIDGDIVVMDPEGLEALPLTARLEDEDGDVWFHEEGKGWRYAGLARHYGPDALEDMFYDYGDMDDRMALVLLNPEILSPAEPVEDEPTPVYALDAEALRDLPITSYVVTPSGAGYMKVAADLFRGLEFTRRSRDLVEVGPILVAHVADPV